jgi:hypothetical protein
MNNLIKKKELEILEIELKIKKLEIEIHNDLDYEVFLPIDGYENYFVSNFGNVKNSKTNRILKPYNDSKGYKIIDLSKNGKVKTFKVHRLVGKAFLENPDNKPMIDHIDNNPANNIVKNLRWCSQKENKCNQDKQINNTSGFKGVSFHKPSNKYRSQININGKIKHIGYYETAEEASKVYEAKAKEIHKEFYYKNK